MLDTIHPGEIFGIGHGVKSQFNYRWKSKATEPEWCMRKQGGYKYGCGKFINVWRI